MAAKPAHRRAGAVLPAMLGAAALAAVPTAEVPAPGAYAAQLCVAVAQAPAQCGEVEFQLGLAGRATLRVQDVTYRLHLRPTQVDVFLFHGNMQIDEFSAAYRWAGGSLEFLDAAKGTHFRLQLGARLPPLVPATPASAAGAE